VTVVGSHDPVYLTQQNVMSFVNECAFTWSLWNSKHMYSQISKHIIIK
jgi:hypothetical protein